jgi:hypothetical protein
MASYFNFLHCYAEQTRKTFTTHTIEHEFKDLGIGNTDAISFPLDGDAAIKGVLTILATANVVHVVVRGREGDRV